MARSTHWEPKAFSEAVLHLYSTESKVDLPARVFTALRCCISFDFLTYHEIIDDRNEREFIDPEYPCDRQVFEAYLHQHLTWNAVVTPGAKSSVKISDFVSRDAWERTDLYQHIFRPQGQNHQLAFIAFGEHHKLGLALNRSTRDFSEEERSRLNLLMPHLVETWKASRLFSSLSDATAAGGQGYVVADNAGHIFFATDKAIGWLREYFGEAQAASLPNQLMDWLRRRCLRFFGDNQPGESLREFFVERPGRRLVVQSLPAFQSEEHQLILRETINSDDATPLEKLGLTKREAEVLFWVSLGKRNCEIGLILGAKERTIYKHLERIFAKLNVETRTAAANVACEFNRCS